MSSMATGFHTLDNAPGDLLARVMDLLLDAVCVVDSQGRYVYVSAACERLFGYTREELIGRNMIELVHPDDRARTLMAAEDIMRGHPKSHFENRYVRKDGKTVHVMWTASWSGPDRLRVAVARDITAYRQSELVQGVLYAILESACTTDDLFALCRRMHEAIGDVLPAEAFNVALYDAAAGAVSIPYSAGRGRAQPAESRPLDPASPLGEVIVSGNAVLVTASGADGEDTDWLGVPLCSARGVIGALELRAGAGRYTPEHRKLLEFISHRAAEVISRKREELEIRHRAYFDALTGLPNRTLFEDRLDTAVKRARRYGENLAVLYLDLDGFKRVNDTHGHEAGDQLLRELAGRLKRCVRDADTVGRRGGDEFTVLLTNIREAGDVDALIAKIQAAVREPFEAETGRLNVSASVGAALYPADGGTAEALYRCADARMYDSKRRRIGASAKENGAP